MSEHIPETTGTRPPSRAPKETVRLMIVFIVAMSLLAIYANVQKLRRSKIEEVQVTPNAAISPASKAPR